MALTKVTGQVIKNTTDVTVGVLTVTNTLAVGGTVSIGGTLTYEDVTNIDSVGLITARNGIVVGSGITLSKDGDIFATGVTTSTTFSGNFSGGTVAGSTGTFTDSVTIVKSSGPLLELTTNTGAADATLRLSEGSTGSTSNGGGMFYSGADNKLHITCGTDSTTKRITIARDDGKIGIGTASPAHALDIQGSSASFTKIALSNQTMNTSKYEIIFGDQGQVNHVVAANREFTIATNGSSNERLRIDSAGNMGLGITPDSHGGTVKSLQIGSATNLYNETSDDYTVLGNNVYFDGTNNKYIKTQESSRLLQNAGEFTFQQAASGSADANITYTTPLKISANGIVTKQYQPAFRAGRSSTQTAAANGTIIFDYVSSPTHFNQGSHYNNSNGAFTAPVAGVYYFYCQLLFQNISNNYNMNDAFYIMYNSSGGASGGELVSYDARRAHYITNETGDSGYYGAHTSVMVDMAANGSVYIRNNRASLEIHGNANFTFFQGFLIG